LRLTAAISVVLLLSLLVSRLRSSARRVNRLFSRLRALSFSPTRVSS
jgi:flagellar biogenesis protein FliO